MSTRARSGRSFVASSRASLPSFAYPTISIPWDSSSRPADARNSVLSSTIKVRNATRLTWLKNRASAMQLALLRPSRQRAVDLAADRRDRDSGVWNRAQVEFRPPQEGACIVSTLAQDLAVPARSDGRARSRLRAYDGAAPSTRRASRPSRSSALDFADRVIAEFALAADVRSGMASAVATLQRGGADRIEWWSPTDDGRALQLATVAGRPGGRRSAIPLGPAGALVVSGQGWSHEIVAATNRLAPVVRRRWTEERLAERAARLASRNQALDDFASLVAHELKAPLHAALLGETTIGLERAVALVDDLLEAARADETTASSSSPAESLIGALRDLGSPAVDVVSNLPETFPLPPISLRLVLRNLVANALAAGARHIVVSDRSTAGGEGLAIDDDGAGLDASGSYSKGSGIGLSLIRRVADRHGGSIELTSGPRGGTRAILSIAGAVR